MSEDLNNAYIPGEDDMEFRLWAYIDGVSPDAAAIEKLIAENSAWRAKYAELLEVHQLMQATELEQPSLRFSKNVMEEIARLQIAPAAREYINKKVIWGIAAFFISIITGFLVYAFSQVSGSAEGSSSPAGVGLPRVDYSRVFDNTFVNLFMMLNVILGLMLLDRYLNMKRKEMRNPG